MTPRDPAGVAAVALATVEADRIERSGQPNHCVSSGGLTLAPEALKGIAGQVVGTLSPHTEADPAALLLTFLAAFGAAVGRGPHVRVGGIEHTAHLFLVLVGKSAKARKGTSWAEVGRVMAVADATFVRERTLGGFGSGEAVVDSVGDSDHRLLVLEPEWSRILAVGRREGATISPLLRQAWDGDRLAVRTRNKTTVADGAHVSLIGHITVEELQAKLTETDTANGYANRHLFAVVKRSQLLPSGGNLDDREVSVLGASTLTRGDAFNDFEPLNKTAGFPLTATAALGGTFRFRAVGRGDRHSVRGLGRSRSHGRETMSLIVFPDLGASLDLRECP